MKKECFKCREIKDLTEFYAHKKMKDGRVNKCKICNKKDVTNNRNENIEHYRLYDKTEARKERRNERTSGACKIYRLKNPNKYMAHSRVNRAIRSGLLKKAEKCSECGKKEKLNGHHDDYNFPLKVRWMCSVCHSDWHKHNEPVV